MHILLGLLGVIIGLGYLLFRILTAYRLGKEVFEDATDLAYDTKAMVRRAKWNRKKNFDPIEQITDPREVAAILLLETAKQSGEVTVSQKQRIKELMSLQFKFTEMMAEQMLAAAAYAVRDVSDLENILCKILRPIHERLTEGEKHDLIGMMAKVAETDGPADAYQVRFISVVKDKVLGTSSSGFA